MAGVDARFDMTTVTDVVRDLFAAAGAREDSAAIVADHLVVADAMGHATHGTRLAPAYVERLRDNRIDGRAAPEIATDRGAVVRIRGRRAFGQVVGAFAAELGAERARQDGLALVALDDAAHLGRNGRWAEIAADRGIGSIHFVNGSGAVANVAPFGGRTGRLGTGPIAMGLPRRSGDHLILDFALSELSVNAILMASERGERLPDPCIIDTDGTLSDDPAAFIERAGAILPFGGFKGYGLAVFAEALAGTLVADVPGNSMFSLFFDPLTLRGADDYEARLDGLVADLHANPPLRADRPVLAPGDRSRRLLAEARRQGVPLGSSLKAILSAAATLGREADARRRLGL